MFQPSIKIDKQLWARIQACAASAGYSSPEEFVQHVLEKELARLEQAESKDELIKKLQGLGYLE
jgi:metal-responsive CopG/Arc/MetJ family transcriptional regulator